MKYISTSLIISILFIYSWYGGDFKGVSVDSRGLFVLTAISLMS
jgi:hypothetical protein